MNLSYLSCQLCPRSCSVNRNETTGFCRSGSQAKVARAALHHWEEPCISGTRGSGTVFFSGCTLRCCFCQNYQISSELFGKEISVRKLADLFLNLQEQGAHNINLVTATQYLPSILPALDLVRHQLQIPIVYNCGGYERIETIELLKDYVNIWLPDLKYQSPQLSARYSQAPNYFEVASKAIRHMVKLAGPPVFETESQNMSLMKSGVVIRHMVLPGAKADSLSLLAWMKSSLPEHGFLVSLLSQYTPFYKSSQYPEINRRITTYEYQQVIDRAIELGLTQGFMQEKSSAKEEYTPPFDLEGID
ncbi:MAG: radical SAM protein [Hungatella sp.]